MSIAATLAGSEINARALERSLPGTSGERIAEIARIIDAKVGSVEIVQVLLGAIKYVEQDDASQGPYEGCCFAAAKHWLLPAKEIIRRLSSSTAEPPACCDNSVPPANSRCESGVGNGR
jgi:hypothetical protein